MKIKKYTTVLSKTHWLFLVIGGIFGLIYAFIAPPLWGLDEIAHFNRVLEVSRGQFIPEKNSKDEMGNDIPKNLAELEYTVYSDLIDNKSGSITQRNDRSKSIDYNKLTSQKLSNDTQESPITATYSPLSYVGPVIGVFIADKLDLSINSLIIFGRIFGLASYLAILVLALRIVGHSKIKWAILLVGLLPTTLFQASVISADTLANAVGILMFAIAFRLGLSKKNSTVARNLLLLLAVCSVFIPLTKINNIFLSFIIIAIPSIYFSTRIKEYLFKVGTVFVSIAGALAWAKLVPVTNSQAISPRVDGLAINPSVQLEYIIHHPVTFLNVMLRTILDASDIYLKSMTVDIGWNVSTMSYAFVFLLFLGMFIAIMYAKEEVKQNKNMIFFMALLSVCGIVSVFAALYVGYNPPAYGQIDGVQGRYFTPFLLPLISLIFLLPLSVQLTRKDTIIFCAISLTTLMCSVVLYAAILR